MAAKATSDDKSDLVIGPAQLLGFGKERTEAVLKMHKDLLDAYREASQVWLSRVKSEVQLWSQLATKLASSKSVPEGLEAYRDSISHRVQMAADDGHRIFEEGQKFIATVTKSMSNGSGR